MRTRRENLLCNGCVKDRVHRAVLHPSFPERNGRYFAKLKREPHAIQARAYARMRQTRARILHVCFLFYTHLSCSLTEKFPASCPLRMHARIGELRATLFSSDHY